MVQLQHFSLLYVHLVDSSHCLFVVGHGVIQFVCWQWLFAAAVVVAVPVVSAVVEVFVVPAVVAAEIRTALQPLAMQRLMMLHQCMILTHSWLFSKTILQFPRFRPCGWDNRFERLDRHSVCSWTCQQKVIITFRRLDPKMIFKDRTMRRCDNGANEARCSPLLQTNHSMDERRVCSFNRKRLRSILSR
jgi:hypothetical protein